jgi:transcriptional regulator with XRE-family HTH domain
LLRLYRGSFGFTYCRSKKGGYGFTQEELGRETGISQSEISRIKLGEGCSPQTRVLLAVLLRTDPALFEANLNCFADGLIPFETVAPSVAAQFPEPFEVFDAPGAQELIALLGNLSSADVAQIAAAATDRLRVAFETRGQQTLAYQVLESLGREKMREVFRLSDPQLDDIEAGRIPDNLDRFQASVLFSDRPIVNPNDFPDPG